jgi:hypothetical protein
MRVLVTIKSDPEGSLPECPASCYGMHPLRLFEIFRRGKAWGHFATALINGERQVIDGSLPHEVDRVPRGARELPAATVASYWHDDNESHVFGGPNVAAALRATIAEANRGTR